MSKGSEEALYGLAIEAFGPNTRPRMNEASLARLRERRKTRRLSLKTVAESAGISIGMLSQIERGKSSPNFSTIKAVCAALEMPLDWLFDDAKGQHEIVVRAHERREMNLGENAMAKALLTPDNVRGIQMMLITIPPGVVSMAERASDGYKCGAVLAGSLGLKVSEEVSLLKKGDSFAFPSTRTHQYWCEGDEPVELIWCVTPAIY